MNINSIYYYSQADIALSNFDKMEVSSIIKWKIAELFHFSVGHDI